MAAALSFTSRKLPASKSDTVIIKQELAKITKFLNKAILIDKRHGVEDSKLKQEEGIYDLLSGCLETLGQKPQTLSKKKTGKNAKNKFEIALAKILPPIATPSKPKPQPTDVQATLQVVQASLLKIINYLKDRVTLVSTEWATVQDITSDFMDLVKVIGMTSTGAAKHKFKITEMFQPAIMIVEEAAHVLESHVVAALTKHCKQMVMIGDHQQLRPSTADSHLTKKYGLDVSLMERLVENGKAQVNQNWVQLNVQH